MRRTIRTDAVKAKGTTRGGYPPPVFKERTMTVVDIGKAAESLDSLITALEEDKAHEVVITRGGQPVARLVPIAETRIGIAKGAFDAPNGSDADDPDVTKLFQDE